MKILRLMARSLALLLIIAGAALWSFAYLYGFFGDVSNFDVPPQDAPPAVAQKYAREQAQSRLRLAQIHRTTENFSRGGAFLLGLGLSLGVVQGVVSLARRPHGRS